MYEEALKRVTGDDGLVCYVFDDRTISIDSSEYEDLKAIIGALLLEAERKPKRRWWQFWR